MERPKRYMMDDLLEDGIKKNLGEIGVPEEAVPTYRKALEVSLGGKNPDIVKRRVYHYLIFKANDRLKTTEQ